METLPFAQPAFAWNRLRAWVPLLGILAILAVAMKLPNMIRLVFGQFICPMCNEPAAFVTTLAGAYFVGLTVLAVCFPRFPGRVGAYIGLLWALFLAAFLLGNPAGRQIIAPKNGQFCPPCAVGHGLHILMWLLWWVLPAAPRTTEPKETLSVPIRLCLVLIAWLAGLGAFGTMHRMMLEVRFPADYTYPRLPSPQNPTTRPTTQPTGWPATRPANP